MVQKVSIKGRLLGYAHWITACVLIMFSLAHASLASAQSHISKTSIGEIVGNDPTVLNWKTNEVVIPFDLPGTVWVDKVEVLISARPTGELRYRRNLKVRVNGSKPIILQAQGQRFDARVTLEQRHLRQRGNNLYISGISTTSACAGPNHAGWEIDKDKSIIVFYGRNMTRDLSMRDLSAMFKQPKSGATKLGLKIVGEDQFRNEALVTQSVTLRTGSIPNLRSAFSGNDLDIVAGVRSDVAQYIRRTSSRSGSGAQIILDESRPPRLILTGDTPADVREAVNAFANHKLPITRRLEVRPAELTLQPVLANTRVSFEKTHKLADAGALRPAEKWITPPLSFKFDTSYAAQRGGELILRLNGNETISDSSSLSVSLNNKPLGQTKIDAKRKTIRLNIPQGHLIGAENELIVTTDLRPDAAVPTCDVIKINPGFSLGLGSKIALSRNVDKTIHDVSNLASPNGPYALSKNVAIISTAVNNTDRLATLRLMGHMAHISGSAWTHADFIEGAAPVIADTENILIIGPRTTALEPFLTHAPKALRLALKGQKIPNIPEERVAEVLRVAALDSNQAFKLASSSARNQAKRFTSGLVSIFDDPDNAQTISVITAYPGGSFSTAAQSLLKPDVWNGLSGSVAQWDGTGARMIQTSQPKLLTQSQPLYIKEVSLNNLISLDWEAFGLVHDDMMEALYKIWDKPASNVSNFIDKVRANIEDKWSAFFSSTNDEPRRVRGIPETVTPEAVTPANAPSETAVKAAKPSLALRGATETTIPVPTAKPTLTPSSPQLTDNLSSGFSALKSNALTAVNSLKAYAQNSYNNFDAWVASMNRNRRAQGLAPIASSPVLALILLLCAGLIIMGLARPTQR